eukprot:jgi/Mesvir1/6982/Mv09122-RA.1
MPAAIDINLGELQDELARAKADLDRWTSSCRASVSCAQQENAKHIAMSEQEVHRLKQRVSYFEQASSEKHRVLKSKNAELEAGRAELSRLASQEEDITGKLSALREEVQTKKANVDLESELLADEGAVRNMKFNALCEALNLYQSRLGLRFDRVEDGGMLWLVFTNIDPSNWAREFSFAVKVHENNVYEVVQCNPPVDEVEGLAKALNESLDFSKFVCQMRRQFRRIVTAEIGARSS